LYSIYDLANTQKGHRVLIHSASGGLGQASIQLCQHIGAEVFVTVGSEEKKKYLMDSFGIPEDHIFSSRTTGFASELMSATGGAGVDVIVNTLTDELLDDSWRCIATGGTMVELGKKDMLDRSFLSMEPFLRNASYRAFDSSHACVTDQLISRYVCLALAGKDEKADVPNRLMGQLMNLISEGHVKPISPIHTFSFADVAKAFRYMRSATHMGKIVITDGPDAGIKVPVKTQSNS
jgi:NADPH:quinone reductase-like Zn-dependent oxidoreductase